MTKLLVRDDFREVRTDSGVHWEYSDHHIFIALAPCAVGWTLAVQCKRTSTRETDEVPDMQTALQLANVALLETRYGV